jgi:hypothetical protein
VNLYVNVNCDFNEFNEKKKCMRMYHLVKVCLHYSHDVYLCDLEVSHLGQGSAARSGQAKSKIAKPSYRWDAAKRPIPRGG